MYTSNTTSRNIKQLVKTFTNSNKRVWKTVRDKRQIISPLLKAQNPLQILNGSKPLQSQVGMQKKMSTFPTNYVKTLSK